MNTELFSYGRRLLLWPALLLFWFAVRFEARANPTGGTVAQGHATISSAGSSLNINQTSAGAWINWQTFNIGQGETVNFNQPSATSVTVNQINDVNPSQILGDINANGYVVLENANGFAVGGNAVLNVHGLVMTTATPTINFSSGGPWSFDAPPPTAKIVNYGQINITGGGTAYLIASDIENNGTISAPGGNIGLYAGEKVLVSSSPDGRGWSAQVTLPQGSVDNEGKLIADAGTIAAQAQTVNQNGLVQANSAKNVNGTIELLASDSMNLGANSTISAQGDSQGTSAGGSVTIESGNTFSDTSGSIVNISGGAQGGNGGSAEISAPIMGDINSTILGAAAPGFTGGTLLIDPTTLLQINAAYASAMNNNILNNGLSSVTIQSTGNIEVSTLWTLAGGTSPSTLTLTAANDITVDSGDGIEAGIGQDWAFNLNAGTMTTPQSQITSGNYGVYLNGSGVLQTASGDINVFAANEVILGNGAIRTIAGGNIYVQALYGSVNTGTSINGLNYYAKGTGTSTSPYYTPFVVTGSSPSTESINFNQSNLGGISTAAGGNVSISAGQNVTSFSTLYGGQSDEVTLAGAYYYEDPGSGCFGPGNVTINAGGSVTGNFMLINGSGSITAGGSIGGPNGQPQVALSLANGGWSLDAQGNIYLQEVRNPNGIFNDTSSSSIANRPTAGYHLFDYSADASVSLTAGNGVYLTGYLLPRPEDPRGNPNPVPIILPPSVTINSGSGGVNLYTPSATDGLGSPANYYGGDVQLFPSSVIPDYTLFPSADGNLVINTLGNLLPADGTAVTLYMSDSSQTRWFDPSVTTTFGTTQPFIVGDDASVPLELNNSTAASIDVGGNMENVTLTLAKFGNIFVGGNMDQCNFFGENLQAGQTTTLTVVGNIDNLGSFNSVVLSQPIATLPNDAIPQGTSYQWYTPLTLALTSKALSATFTTPQEAAEMLANSSLGYQLLGSQSINLTYDSTTKTMIAIGSLSSSVAGMLTETLYVPVYNAQGLPELSNGTSGTLVTHAIQLVNPVDANLIINNTGQASLVTESKNAPALGSNSGSFIVGGTGNFDVTANTINLGNSDGILTVGNGIIDGRNYSNLTHYIDSGANLDVKITGPDQSASDLSLEMAASTIAALGGGSVTVDSENGSMDLGSQLLEQFESEIMRLNGNIGLGIYTTAGGNVTVTADGNVNIDTSRIATFNGGNVSVTSLTGDVDAGSGGDILVPINLFSPFYNYRQPVFESYANGIVAETLPPREQIPGTQPTPGDIIVNTPEGSIYADLGGIEQEALGLTLPPGPSVTLDAGTANPPGDWNSTAAPLYVGNIILGNSGAIGGDLIVQATGTVSGLAVGTSSVDLESKTVANFTAIGPTVNVTAQGAQGTITLIGTQSVNASGLSGSDNLQVFSQNASVNGTGNQNTMGTTTTSASSQSAAQQSTQSAAQQVALNATGDDTDDKKKKKKATVKVSHVSVLLSAAVPAH